MVVDPQGVRLEDLADDFGQRIGAHNYYPYGLDALIWGVQEPQSRFAGHELDRHGVTYYMLARSYIQSWGRFANVDPARSWWNLYAYADDNPIRFVDPTGLADQPAAEDDGLSATDPAFQTGVSAFLGIYGLAVGVVSPPVGVAAAIGSVVLSTEPTVRDMASPPGAASQEATGAPRDALAAVDQAMGRTRATIQDAKEQMSFLAAEEKMLSAMEQGQQPSGADRARFIRGIFSGSSSPSANSADSRSRRQGQQQRLERAQSGLQRQQGLRDRLIRSAAEAMLF